MKRLRVLQVLECGGPGGAGNQVAAICRGLDKSRFETVLAYAVRAPHAPRDYEVACAPERAYHLPEMTREIAPARDLRAFLKLRRLMREERPDVVHAHSSKAGVLARAAAFAAGVPRVFYSPRGYGFLQADRSRLSRALYYAAEAAVSWIGTTLAVSPSEAALAPKLFGLSGVCTVPDAYLGEVPQPKRHAETEHPLVAALGRLCFARRPEAFLPLAAALPPKARAVWIGDGESLEALRRRTAETGLADRLEWTGWLPHARALSRLGEADVFVHYSRWEGLPNAVMEAMACGLPVVASEAPGNRDLVEEGKTGFLVRSEAELAERCALLLGDPALRARMGERGRERILSEFTLERLIKHLARLYAE